MVADAVLEYILKKQKLKANFWSIMTLNQSARQVDITGSWKNEFKLWFKIGSFLGVKLCMFNVLYHPISPQRYDTSASGVILNPNILRQYKALTARWRIYSGLHFLSEH